MEEKLLKLKIEQVLKRLNKVKKTREGWQACCPVHDDKNPSLSISVNETNGNLLLYCHAGCSFEEIIFKLRNTAVIDKATQIEETKSVIDVHSEGNNEREHEEKIEELQDNIKTASFDDGTCLMNETLQEYDVRARQFFNVRSANKCIWETKNKPIPKMLFGEFWYEGEVSILFADTNVGKSILAVQVADSITRGQQIGDLNLNAEPQGVLYFDFELSDLQFSIRYSDNDGEWITNEFKFSEELTRLTINDHAELGGSSFEQILFENLELCLTNSNIKVVIIDNLSYLKSDNENAKDATPLMQRIKALKNKYNLSILVLAHTPKRDLSRVITENDLAGSKSLMNFCDSAFSIGKSSVAKNTRYVKQIKARNSEMIFDESNVVVCEIVKANNFLHFELKGNGNEYEHLQQRNSDKANEERFENIQKARSLAEIGMPQRKIADQLGIAPSTVNKYVKAAKSDPVEPLIDVHVQGDTSVANAEGDMGIAN